MSTDGRNKRCTWFYHNGVLAELRKFVAWRDAAVHSGLSAGAAYLACNLLLLPWVRRQARAVEHAYSSMV